MEFKREFKRLVDLDALTNEGQSLFLFGARGTGKTHLIRDSLSKHALVIDLLKTQIYSRLAEDPSLLENMILESGKNLVVIDEVQRLPSLLNEAHRLIEEKNILFLLTGSSARKLKRGQANLLAGRALLYTLLPLTSHEIPKFDLERYLLWGGLPKAWNLKNPTRFLDTYIEVYLKEEILAEQVARSLPHFSRFLRVAALSSGNLLNFAAVASDAQVSESTVKNYFEALQDTLVGTLLEPWIESTKRKAIATGKFYFFDIGVCNRILNLNEIPEGSELYGRAFEHFLFMELKAFQAYYPSKLELKFWRSVSRHEVDFLLGEKLAIEVKASRRVHESDAKNLKILREEGRPMKYFVVSNDPINRERDGISYYYWKDFLARLWGQLDPKKGDWLK